jgi:hypothetical protein
MKRNIASKCICRTFGRSLQGVSQVCEVRYDQLINSLTGGTSPSSHFLLVRSQRIKKSSTVPSSPPIFRSQTHSLSSQVISVIGTPSSRLLEHFTNVCLGERDSTTPSTTLHRHPVADREADSLERTVHLIHTPFMNPLADLTTKLWIPSLCHPPRLRRLIRSFRCTSRRRKTLSAVDIPLGCSSALYHS